MSEPKSEQAPDDAPDGRSREQMLREIRLALAIDGLTLSERRRLSRGVDPYDSSPQSPSTDPWRRQRRG
jgi:hypothetical protein